MTFKELQVSQQMKKEYNRDSELLQLIVTHKSQIRIYEMQTSLEEGGGSSEVHRERDSMDLYKKAGFSWDVKVGFRNAPRFDIESKNRPLLGLDDMARPPNKLEIHTTANQLHSMHSQSGGEENSFDDFFRSLFAKTRVEPKFPDKQRDCSCLWLRNLRYRGHQRELLESNISEDRYVDMLEQWSKKKGRLSLLIKTLNEFGYDELATKLSRGEIYESTIKQERSFQNRIYGFLQLVKRHRPDHKRLMGLDISFDGMGCSFILAWAFDVVCEMHIIDVQLMVPPYHNRFAFSISIHITILVKRMLKRKDFSIRSRSSLSLSTTTHYLPIHLIILRTAWKECSSCVYLTRMKERDVEVARMT
jgi:hypothetical protein